MVRAGAPTGSFPADVWLVQCGRAAAAAAASPDRCAEPCRTPAAWPPAAGGSPLCLLHSHQPAPALQATWWLYWLRTRAGWARRWAGSCSAPAAALRPPCFHQTVRYLRGTVPGLLRRTLGAAACHAATRAQPAMPLPGPPAAARLSPAQAAERGCLPTCHLGLTLCCAVLCCAVQARSSSACAAPCTSSTAASTLRQAAAALVACSASGLVQMQRGASHLPNPHGRRRRAH